eukprot:1189626-Prorocentrum_minimum.AAC.9
MRFRGPGHVSIISEEYFTRPESWADPDFTWPRVVIGLRAIKTFAPECRAMIRKIGSRSRFGVFKCPKVAYLMFRSVGKTALVRR